MRKLLKPLAHMYCQPSAHATPDLTGRKTADAKAVQAGSAKGEGAKARLERAEEK